MTLFFFVVQFFFIFFLIYSKVWKRFRVDTPTGSGIILLFSTESYFFSIKYKYKSIFYIININTRLLL